MFDSFIHCSKIICKSLLLFLFFALFEFSSYANKSDYEQVIQTKQRFEKIYDDFLLKYKYGKYSHLQSKKLSIDPSYSLSSITPKHLPPDDINNFKKLGISILPLIVEKMKDVQGIEFSKLAIIFESVSKKRFYRNDLVNQYKPYKYDWHIEWWEKERILSEEAFNRVYEEWKKEIDIRDMNQLFNMNKESDLGNYPNHLLKLPDEYYIRSTHVPRTIIHQFRDLGVAAIPHAFTRIKQGDSKLISTVNYWTDDALQNSATEHGISNDQMLEYSLIWWEDNKEEWLLSPIEEKGDEQS
jgi:hypothetical protein